MFLAKKSFHLTTTAPPNPLLHFRSRPVPTLMSAPSLPISPPHPSLSETPSPSSPAPSISSQTRPPYSFSAAFLHDFLCAFQSPFWHSGEQYRIILQALHFFIFSASLPHFPHTLTASCCASSSFTPSTSFVSSASSLSPPLAVDSRI